VCVCYDIAAYHKPRFIYTTGHHALVEVGTLTLDKHAPDETSLRSRFTCFVLTPLTPVHHHPLLPVLSNNSNMSFEEKAAALEREQKDIEEEIKAGESSVINGLVRTADDLLNQGRAADALQLYEMSLEKLTKTEGEDHRDTLRVMNDVGCALGSLNRHEESLALFQKSLKKRIRVLGEDNPSMLTTMSNVASQLSCLKRYDESLDMSEKAVEKLTLIQGEEHPNTVTALNNLVFSQYNAGRHDEARQNASRCQILARNIGDEDTAARCVKILSKLDDRKAYHDPTSTSEQRRLITKIDDRKQQA
jgi:tetratricopeptide (TPR) repeat protein